MKLNNNLVEIDDSTGEISSAGTVLFRANQSADASNVTGDGTEYPIICNVELIDTNNNYNNTTGVFTVPSTGMYTLSYSVGLGYNGLKAAHTRGRLRFDVNSGAAFIVVEDLNIGAVFETLSGQAEYVMAGSIDVYLSANDAIFMSLYVANDTKTVSIPGTGGNFGTSFSGHKIVV